jgi:hypothetical protein
MKKNSRDQYLKTWLTYLKGKDRLDPKALAEFLGKTLKGALSPITMKRYTATVIANLYENGFLAGKTGKTFSGEPLEIVREVTLPVLDKSLTRNYRKVTFAETEPAAAPVGPATKAPAPKKARKAAGKSVKAKTRVKKAVKPEPKKPVEAQAEKPVGRKTAPRKKKAAEKPKKRIIVKARKTPAKKPGRKPAAEKPGLIGRRTDLIKMGEGAFLYSLELTRRIEEMEEVIGNYERMFEAVRNLFSREMEEMEELVAGLLG